MKSPFSRVARRLVAVLVLTCAACGVTAGSALATYDPTDPAQKAQYDQALGLGAQAYVFGEPLLNMQRTFNTETSVNVCDGRGDGPVNQFCSFRQLADPADRTVVAPNHDTLYSIAWLDLKSDALMLRVPNTGSRYSVVPFLTPWQENAGTIGTGADDIRQPGDYVLAGPNYDGKLPAGIPVIRMPYTRMWIIARTLVKDDADVPNVWSIQDGRKIVPLSKWLDQGWNWTPKPPTTPDTTVDKATIPGTQAGDDPLAFFDALNAEMKTFKPRAEDQPLLDQLAAVGIGPGAKPVSANNKLTDAQLAGLKAAVAAGKARVNADLLARFQAGFGAHNGYLVTPTGNYGTDYGLRAIVSAIGLGALPANVQMYPFAQTDRTGARLNASAKRYVVHFNAPDNPLLPQLPVPVQSAWSLTMYDADQFFVPNAIDRYLINDRTNLHYNADGSLDLYVQANQPGDAQQAQNWLPAPNGVFNLQLRLYGTDANSIAGILDGTGWKSPTVLPCGPTGMTPAFPPAGISAPIACATAS